MVDKSFKDYVQDTQREYSFRIKTVVPLDDEAMEYIEKVLQKYVLKDISAPIKTILQKHPLDFVGIQNAEVWIVDASTLLPISAYVLLQELKLALNIPEKFIVVRSPNDPLEVQTENMVASDEITMMATEKGLSPASRLSTNSSYDVDELGELDSPLYGNEYNSKFLATLAQVAASRVKQADDPKSEGLNNKPDKSDPSDLTVKNDFNDGIKSAPKPVYSNYADTLKNLRKKGVLKDPMLSTTNNYDNDEIKQSKKYDNYGETKKVSTVVITNKKPGIRKTK